MPRIAMEHIEYELNVPPQGANGDKMFFVQIDAEKCIGCDTCQEYCPTGAIVGETGLAHKVAHVEPCINCGQCLTHCPENAIYEVQTWVPELREKLKDKNVKCIAMPAPSVRYALGEAFGLAPGSVTTGKMLSALKALGFAHCWDTEFAADVTIWEEASEFVARLGEKKDLPQFTSCCPGWQKYAETFYPDLLPHFSSCKSPIGMNGPLAKTYGAEKLKYDPKQIYAVSIMPCIAKKYEGLRPELAASGLHDIDATLTTRELAYLIRQAGIDFNKLPDGQRDSLMGESTGGATIFGVSGGIEKINKVMMPAFFILFIIIAVRVAFLPNAIEGYKYLLVPQWEYLFNPRTWIMAMGQAFFSLSITGSGMIIYGSYLPKNEDVVHSSCMTAV